MTIRVLHGDCRDVLKTLPDASVQCVVTSPPYYGLRDYGTATWDGGDAECDHKVILGGNGAASSKQVTSGGTQSYQARGICPHCGATRIDSQIGLESSPEAYIAELVAVFREVRRVLRDDGVCWLNIGDSYNSGSQFNPSDKRQYGESKDAGWPGHRPRVLGLKPKDLLMIPSRVAIALQADGWYLRSDTIWAKPNPMPESCTDRPTSSHEHVFLLTKNARYFYDAEAVKEDGVIPAGTLGAKGSAERFGTLGVNSRPPEYKVYDGKRNLRNVWTITTKPYAGANFSVMPPELAEICIKDGTSERVCCANFGAPWVRIMEYGNLVPPLSRPDAIQCKGNGETTQLIKGAAKSCFSREKTATGWSPSCKCATASSVVPCTVLDPFGGAGTTGLVADRLGRSSIMIDLNATYTETAIVRMTDDCPMFVDIAPAEPEPHTPDMFAEAAE